MINITETEYRKILEVACAIVRSMADTAPAMGLPVSHGYAAILAAAAVLANTMDINTEEHAAAAKFIHEGIREELGRGGITFQVGGDWN